MRKIVSLNQKRVIRETSLSFKADIGELLGKFLFAEKTPSVRASEGVSGETFISEDLVFKFMTHPNDEDRLFNCFLEFWANNFMKHYYPKVPQTILIPENKETTQIIEKINREHNSHVKGPLLIFPRVRGLNIKGVLDSIERKKQFVENQDIFMQQMGEMALLDLIIHNNDRLVKLEKRDMKKKVLSRPNLGNMMLLDEKDVCLVPIDNAPNVFNPRFADVIKENFYSHFDSDRDFSETANCIATGLDIKLRAKELRLDKHRMANNLRIGLQRAFQNVITLTPFEMPFDEKLFSQSNREQLVDFFREVYNRIDFFKKLN